MTTNIVTVLSLGTSAIRIAKLSGNRDNWQITDKRAVEVPSALKSGTENDEWPVFWEELTQKELRDADKVVLGVPTSSLMVKLLKFPVAAGEDLSDAISLQMDKLSPLSADELTYGYEIIAESNDEITVLAAALPNSYFEALEGPLKACGVKSLRIDAALLGWWHAIRAHEELQDAAGRCILLVRVADEWDLMILDNGVPIFIRGLGVIETAEDLVREVMLSMLHAEAEHASLPLNKVVMASAHTLPGSSASLQDLTGMAVRQISLPDENIDALGIAWRTVDAQMAVALDLTPAAWKQQAASAVTQRRFLFGLGAAVAVWVISAAVLWGGPVVLEKLVKWREQQIQKIASDYKQVANAMERVKLIRNYMDRSNSVLESMRTVVISQPEGVDLTSLTYRRGESIKVSGEALDPSNVYAFKDGIENNPPFGICTLGAVSYDGVRRKHRFELEARFGKAGGEQ